MLDELWRKFYFLEPLASACGLTLSPLGQVREDPDTRAVLVACIDEVRALAEAIGVTLPATADAVAVADGLPADMTPSLLRALQTGGKLEIDALQGEVVRLGRRLGVPTPVHQLVYAALKLRPGYRSR
jgi:2-dehydropantoate 2-reductase